MNALGLFSVFVGVTENLGPEASHRREAWPLTRLFTGAGKKPAVLS